MFVSYPLPTAIIQIVSELLLSLSICPPIEVLLWTATGTSGLLLNTAALYNDEKLLGQLNDKFVTYSTAPKFIH